MAQSYRREEIKGIHFPELFPRFYKPAANSNKRSKKDSDRIQIGNPGLVWAIVATAVAAGITFLLPDLIAAIWLFLTS